MATKTQNRPAFTAQGKMIAVNDKFGNKTLKKQQGTTTEIYDSIPLVATKLTYDFFINAKTRQFPFTNLLDGKLTPEESFVLKRMYFAIMSVTDATGAIADIVPLTLTANPGFAAGEMAFFIVNTRVLRPMPLRSFFPEFNDQSDSTVQTVFNFDTDLVVPPLLEFKVSVQFPELFYTAVEGTTDHLICSIGGPGAIFAPGETF